LKTQYLRGVRAEKQFFRDMMATSERRLGAGQPSGISPLSSVLLATFPAVEWRARRRSNYDTMRKSAAAQCFPGGEVLTPQRTGCCPLGAVLILESSEQREYVKRALLKERIYPAVLWPLNKPLLHALPAVNLELSTRMLFLHCDMRYDETDMLHVADLVRRSCASYESGGGGT
jgi:hypothetical protein